MDVHFVHPHDCWKRRQDPLPSGDQTVANGLPVVVALEKGAAIRKWLRKAPRKRLLQGPPASVALGDVSGTCFGGIRTHRSARWSSRSVCTMTCNCDNYCLRVHASQSWHRKTDISARLDPNGMVLPCCYNERIRASPSTLTRLSGQQASIIYWRLCW